MDERLTCLEQAVQEQILEQTSFDLDVYQDLFSSEYVYDVIYNHPERIQKIQPVLERLNFIQNTHFVLTIIFDNFWMICEKRNNAYRYQLKRTLLNQTRAVLSKLHPASVAATLIGTDKVVVLLECAGMQESEAEQYVYQCAEALRDGIMRRTTFSVSIGVSNYCHSASNTWRAYEQSFLALSGSFVLGYANILKYREKRDAENVLKQNEVSTIAKRFATAVSSCDGELCKKHVDYLFQRLAIITADENYVKSYVVLVLSEVIQYCIRLGMDANDLSRRLIVMIQDAFQSGTIARLQENTAEFLQGIIGVQDLHNQFLSDRIHVAYAYIQQFHAESISLQDLAQLCGYSGAYFCRLFKKTFGKTYTAFLTECRIEHAKQLLRESTSSISEVSEITGFHSLSHFCVCFRNETGKTPSEYRSGWRGEQDGACSC